LWLQLLKLLPQLANNVLFQPILGENVLVTRTRDLLNRGCTAFLPFLVPLLVYRDCSWVTAELMNRYWQLKAVTDQEALLALQDQYELDYCSFGLVASALNYVPILNWTLGLTNSVGAALFAVELEKRRSKQV